jgi:hypothetical protein
MLNVKYGNRFVKYKMQVARVMFGFGPGSTYNIFGLGPGRAGSGRAGSGKILKFRPV